ncbi:hypothetical protein BD289DRAFT_450516 [Coniella lustricola]|uniref:Beta/gamma crystallin 'Greek key' domain-containing protein n=1 Tax=Coniella lustricola TaxID=2025994 RepID=A0A2T3AIT7_9PEZI|nr:hypothetical protein BD289DRAFT_450516 [Coniella lustricola]
MQITSTLTTGAVLLASMLGMAHARNYGIMYLDVNAGGTSSDFASDTSDECISFTGTNSFWDDDISSLHIFANQQCKFYENPSCTGTSDTFTGGSAGTVYNTVPQNDAYSSFRCVSLN